jgi:hypothetical protein|tara:strand:- start:781 stop:1086 length:306 start_codon:yes stop_codon:yes gene_type:complete
MTIKVENGDICPLMGKTCIGLQCAWFTKVQGTNPQTGKDVEDWACAVAWLPMLAIENSQNTRMSGAAVESFRNEMVRRMDMPAMPRPTRISDVDITNLLDS